MISAGHAPAPAGLFDFVPRTRLVFGAGTVAQVGELARELGVGELARPALLPQVLEQRDEDHRRYPGSSKFIWPVSHVGRIFKSFG
jgi:hypothetical protein